MPHLEIADAKKSAANKAATNKGPSARKIPAEMERSVRNAVSSKTAGGW